MTLQLKIVCDSFSTWWHLPCAHLTLNAADALDSWLCQSCLADAANHDYLDDDLNLDFNEEFKDKEEAIVTIM